MVYVPGADMTRGPVGHIESDLRLPSLGADAPYPASVVLKCSLGDVRILTRRTPLADVHGQTRRLGSDWHFNLGTPW